MADSFEIFTSPLIMELIVAENEEVFIIEAAPEFGGEFLSDILIPERTGYNIIKESIKAVINNKFTPPPSNRNYHNTIVVKYITGKKGTLLSFNPLKNNSPEIIFSRIFFGLTLKFKYGPDTSIWFINSGTLILSFNS